MSRHSNFISRKQVTILCIGMSSILFTFSPIQARAWVNEAIGVAGIAMSMMKKGDGSTGALILENIKLNREILASLADVNKGIKSLLIANKEMEERLLMALEGINYTNYINHLNGSAAEFDRFLDAARIEKEASGETFSPESVFNYKLVEDNLTRLTKYRSALTSLDKSHEAIALFVLNAQHVEFSMASLTKAKTSDLIALINVYQKYILEKILDPDEPTSLAHRHMILSDQYSSLLNDISLTKTYSILSANINFSNAVNTSTDIPFYCARIFPPRVFQPWAAPYANGNSYFFRWIRLNRIPLELDFAGEKISLEQLVLESRSEYGPYLLLPGEAIPLRDARYPDFSSNNAVKTLEASISSEDPYCISHRSVGTNDPNKANWENAAFSNPNESRNPERYRELRRIIHTQVFMPTWNPVNPNEWIGPETFRGLEEDYKLLVGKANQANMLILEVESYRQLIDVAREGYENNQELIAELKK